MFSYVIECFGHGLCGLIELALFSDVRPEQWAYFGDFAIHDRAKISTGPAERMILAKFAIMIYQSQRAIVANPWAQSSGTHKKISENLPKIGQQLSA